ncbi:GNAT family N-acetyltransferase [Sphingomicrobium aestuariivivum]|uniref:GNAT family N-acetyltransferase n=1 Tax=Sphingomicrobium aestuariivivum TaxID=1582356 RepID=UPI001FD6FFE5|nr:GNAT family N-acetyltransferase [Sphingomicrobium aestuariivivum]MCJ8191916.1 N-acetyltransferase [Sphingomicrobium aestuariivivum]
MDIIFEEKDGRGRWHVRPEGADEDAEMTFSRTNAELIMIDHTFVPPSARGQGIAGKLAQAAVDKSRAEGWKIIPVCPYMKAEAEKHDDWDDVIQR